MPPFFRASMLSNYSPEVVPDPERQWSVLCEVSSSAAMPLPGGGDGTSLSDACVAGLADAGFVGEGVRVHHVWRRDIPFGYPTPFLGRDAALNRVMPALRRHRVWSRGRFGGWKYECSNQDHAFMQGVEAVDDAVLGIDERTYPHPDTLERKVAGRPFRL